jgi:hypothetical protein
MSKINSYILYIIIVLIICILIGLALCFKNKTFRVLVPIFIVILLFSFFYHKESLEIQFAPILTNPPQNPKDELVQYFASNWARLAPILIKDNCDDEYVPSELMNEFKMKFGHFFEDKSEQTDPMMKHYLNGTYERNFKMEIKEICKTLTALGNFINSVKYPARQLKEIAIELERLHTEHFPQAVFISIIIDRMLQICNKYPEYNTDQIANTNDLLTISIIFYLTKPKNTQ